MANIQHKSSHVTRVVDEPTGAKVTGGEARQVRKAFKEWQERRGIKSKLRERPFIKF